MRIGPKAAMVLLCMAPTLLIADECPSSTSPIVDVLEMYSSRHGTKFAIDPRVRANVTLIGIDANDLDFSTLIGVLDLHGFAALVKDDVVYVMPTAVSERIGGEFGVRWGGE